MSFNKRDFWLYLQLCNRVIWQLGQTLNKGHSLTHLTIYNFPSLTNFMSVRNESVDKNGSIVLIESQSLSKIPNTTHPNNKSEDIP